MTDNEKDRKSVMGSGQAGFGFLVGLGGEGEREVKHNSKVLDSGD